MARGSVPTQKNTQPHSVSATFLCRLCSLGYLFFFFDLQFFFVFFLLFWLRKRERERNANRAHFVLFRLMFVFVLTSGDPFDPCSDDVFVSDLVVGLLRQERKQGAALGEGMQTSREARRRWVCSTTVDRDGVGSELLPFPGCLLFRRQLSGLENTQRSDIKRSGKKKQYGYQQVAQRLRLQRYFVDIIFCLFFLPELCCSTRCFIAVSLCSVGCHRRGMYTVKDTRPVFLCASPTATRSWQLTSAGEPLSVPSLLSLPSPMEKEKNTNKKTTKKNGEKIKDEIHCTLSRTQKEGRRRKRETEQALTR